MAIIRAIFWDVGGVLLSNAWDQPQRESALAKFGLNRAEFSSRHDMVVSSFERGKLSLDEYLHCTVFYQARPFTLQAFKQYMFSLSQPRPEVLQIAKGLKQSCRYRMATINNESRELNQFRIESFGLAAIFDFFVSSCFVGLRKPEDGIYRLALDLAQVPPDECCFVDDRPLNVEAAARFGMHAIRMECPAQLIHQLEMLGVQGTW